MAIVPSNCLVHCHAMQSRVYVFWGKPPSKWQYIVQVYLCPTMSCGWNITLLPNYTVLLIRMEHFKWPKHTLEYMGPWRQSTVICLRQRPRILSNDSVQSVLYSRQGWNGVFGAKRVLYQELACRQLWSISGCLLALVYMTVHALFLIIVM